MVRLRRTHSRGDCDPGWDRLGWLRFHALWSLDGTGGAPALHFEFASKGVADCGGGCYGVAYDD